MGAEIVQTDYDELAAIARRFAQQAQANRALHARVQRNVSALRQGGWQGKGSAAFFGEMDQSVFPVLQRLSDALTAAQSTTLQIEALIRQAEEEAASVFRGEYSGQNQQQSWWDSWGEWVHGGLDVLGFVPVIGEAADGINGLIYLAEGRKVEAGISFASMIPVVGDVGKGGKWALKAGKELLEEGTERTVKESVESVIEHTVKEGAERSDDFLRFGQLKPNTKYVRNDYEYTTDTVGRTNRVTGELTLGDAPRTAHQTAVGRMGLPSDEGGHLIGSRFGGTPEGVNLIPQNMNLNRGNWKKMENDWDRALQEGKAVNVDIRVVYPSGNSFRPQHFEVKYTIDGQSHHRIFPNKPGG
ncbi:MAG: WXG100 family type VII secretion target [Caldilineaceae bacterium]|nr:WXG100 family type VII secretion target [Caldilineaceae bacterium]